MFAGVTSSSRATCPNTEMRRRDMRWHSDVRPVRCSTSLFRSNRDITLSVIAYRHTGVKLASKTLITTRIISLLTNNLVVRVVRSARRVCM